MHPILIPFITFLALYQVSAVNNFFTLLTIPTTVQFVFGLMYAGYTDGSEIELRHRRSNLASEMTCC